MTQRTGAPTGRAQALIATALFIVPLVVLAADPPSTVECRRPDRSSPVKIDGLLDDVAWEGAVWYDGFTQSVPVFGQPATERTAVAFLHDEQNIYAAIRCDDR